MSLLKILCGIALLALGACASGQQGPRGAGLSSRHAGLQCAPFARELSGIALYGDAADWWDGAAGRYGRGQSPMLGGVLVFQRTGRLPFGHVSVVSRVMAARQIEVIQANWVAGQLDEDQLVVDVSEANDWSAVRVWYPPADQLGAHTYETYGFVLPPRPATRAELARATRPAARLAISSGGRSLPRARLVGG